MRSGACNPWINGDELALSPAVINTVAQINKTCSNTNPVLPGITDEQVNVLCAVAASAASDMLYNRTARQFTGECGPVTIRPVARPTNADTRAWVWAGGGGWGYGWGASAMGNLGLPPVQSLYAEEVGAVIELMDYPINNVSEVKIDGVVIPSDEYELRNARWLLRMLPTAQSVPTQRWGWPTSQLQYLPDTQPATFSITYTYGQDPGDGGRMACLALAQNILMPMLGELNAYPERTTQITRQGVTMQIASVIDIMKSGGTGIRTVDLWIRTVNPQGLARRPRVWSPDVARNQRQRFPSRPA